MTAYLVTGATGNVGREVVVALRAEGHEVRAVTRDPSGADFPDDVHAVAGDLNDPASLFDAVDGVLGLFLIPGYDGAAELLAHARGQAVDRVVLLSGGSAGSGDTTNAITRFMVASETAVRTSGLAWTFIRPNAFMSNALRWRDQLTDGNVLRLPFARLRSALVHPADIAAVAARALIDGGHAERIHRPSGPQSLSLAEQVAILGEGLKRSLRLQPIPDDEARAALLAQMPEDYVAANLDFYVAGSLDESQVSSDVEDVTGRQPRTFAEWVAEHAGEFGA